ncbi:AAA family ATPase [Candidatus Saccharibacteria bacterium]|nr:AAA family ATPase [Candidatus Saccharibacteria bacterium]
MRRRHTQSEIAIKDAFLSTLPPRKNDGKPFYTIFMLGLPGVGKSSIAKEIADKLGIYVFTADKVRRLLNDYGYVGDNPDQEMVEYISGKATRYLLNNRISYIMDGDSIRFVKNLRRKSKSVNSKFILIRVICSEKETVNRIKLRQATQDKDNYSRATEKTYFARKQLHEKLPRKIFYTFNSELGIEPQINKFLSLLGQA